MDELRERMTGIEDPRHASYVRYPLVDILLIVMCGVLSGLDTLGDLVIYAKSKAEFLSKELGIEGILPKITFARVLSIVDGEKVDDAIYRYSAHAVWHSGRVNRCGWKGHMQYGEAWQSSQRPTDTQRVCDQQWGGSGPGSHS